jgi:GT2 family glycosyltransferase
LNSPVSLSIIIVNYNVEELLIKCIESIYNFHKGNFEIILVDNNSTDNSTASVQDKFPQVIVIANKSNAGFPKANNQGIAIAKGDFILLLNPDTEITDNSIEKLIAYYNSKQELLILVPKLLNSDLSLQQSVQPFITVGEIVSETFFLHKWYKRSKSYFINFKDAIQEVEAVSGAAILIKKEVINKIGGLDEDLFWTEDMEFCYRAHLNGIKRIYYPNTSIIHHVGQSGNKNMNVMLSNQVLTKIKYFEKNHSYWEFVIVKWFRFIHILSRILIFGVLSIFNSKYKTKFMAYKFTFKHFMKNNY